jgi:hypothetical protein
MNEPTRFETAFERLSLHARLLDKNLNQVNDSIRRIEQELKERSLAYSFEYELSGQESFSRNATETDLQIYPGNPWVIETTKGRSLAWQSNLPDQDCFRVLYLEWEQITIHSDPDCEPRYRPQKLPKVVNKKTPLLAASLEIRLNTAKDLAVFLEAFSEVLTEQNCNLAWQFSREEVPF